MSDRRASAHRFEIRARGWPDPEIPAEVRAKVAGVERQVRTVLRCRVQDEAGLYGALRRLRSYGLEVVEIRQESASSRPTTEEATSTAPSRTNHEATENTTPNGPN